MLTKNDLKAISTIVQSQIDEGLERELKPVREDIAGVKNDFAGVKNDLAGVKKDIKTVKSKLSRAAKDIKYMSGKFDEEIVYTRRRVDKIEEHLHLEPPKN